MKRIITLLLVLFTFYGFVKANDTEQKLTLRIYYTQPSDTVFVSSLRNSSQTCCKYEIVAEKSSENKILVFYKENSIGTIYGYPTERFLLDIYDRVFAK